ncbi:MAG: sulfite exporter TauE/SafE family protein [Deltaproteobacteria bacterium]|nr:sulfite exporter TauE/SafE family protein [Deltaproteobacteria bacterium]
MNELTEKEKRFRVYLVVLAFALFTVFLFGLVYLATTPAKTLTMLLSFSGGISNIVLPCTLPLVFIIVPLAMSAGSAKKGLGMAVLFGAGLTITLSIYGAAIAQVGKYLGLDDATRIMYGLAGLAALIFGLSELKLIKFELPTYMRMPQFIQKQGDYVKVFLLGLLLGNAGVGCPNPVTYIILTFAATTGDWAQGALLMAVNGIGRVVPLLFLTVLGILGVNAIGGLTKRMEGIRKFTAWVLVVLGAFIIFNGIYGHLWYEGGIFHEGLNYAFMKIGGKMVGEADIAIGQFEKKVPYVEYGAWMNLAITLIVVFWYWLKYPGSRKEALTVFIIFLVWGLILLDVGLDAMKLAGLSEGLPEEMLKAMPWMKK